MSNARLPRILLRLRVAAAGAAGVSCAPGTDRPAPPDRPAPQTAVESTPPTVAPSADDSTASSAAREGTADPAAGDLRPSAALRARVAATADTLARTVRFPIRLPTLMSGAPDDDATYVTILSSSPDAYEVVYGDVDCTGGTACRVGSASARRLAPGERRAAGRAVTIPGLGAARFEESTCGANCSDGVLAWEQDGVRYAVGLKAAELADLRPVAASIARLPRDASAP